MWFTIVSIVCIVSSAVVPVTLAENEKATCVLVGSISGNLSLDYDSDKRVIVITGSLKNITKGPHGFHVHEKGDLGNGCMDAGGHYNPLNVSHGGKEDALRHVGDWGNINVDTDPFDLHVIDRVATLEGEHSIMDRAIVIHSKADDLGKGGTDASKANGNAGARQACCKITSSSMSTLHQSSFMAMCLLVVLGFVVKGRLCQ